MRKISGKSTLKDTILKNPLGRKIFIMAGAGALSVAAGLIASEKLSNNSTIAVVQELEGDAFEGTVPLLDEKGEIITELRDGAIIVIDGKMNKKDNSDNVMAISEDGQFVEGIIPKEYLKKVKTIKKEDLQQYDTIYRVIPKDGVNLRSTPEQAENNKVDAIAYDEYVLGATRKFTDKNKFLWIPSIYVNEEGEFVEGYIRSDLLEKMSVNEEEKEDNQEEQEKQATQEENLENVRKKRVVDTSSDKYVDLNLRSETNINSNNIITTIPNGSIVYIIGEETYDNDCNWTYVEYEDSDGNMKQGWVASAYLKENQVVKVVDTSEDNFHPLNVRQKPGFEGKIIATIEHGTEINLTDEDIENIKQQDNLKWVKVTLPDGTNGYVSYAFLRDKSISETKKEEETVKENAENQEEAKKEVINNLSVNDYGKVVGIDVSRTSSESLRALLQEGTIPGNVKGKDTSDLKGKISYVYIKMGASAYGKNSDGQVLLNDQYEELAKVCEEFGIPFGFYYYSTCLNNTEAQREAEAIKGALDSVKNMKYYLLPFSVDVELANNASEDRQQGIDTSEAKATLANLLMPITGKTILYTSYRHAYGSEKIMDVNTYNSLLDGGPTKIWVGAARDEKKRLYSDHQEFCNFIVNGTSSDLSILQAEPEVSEKELGAAVDINIADKDEFIELLSYREMDLNKDANKKGEELEY